MRFTDANVKAYKDTRPSYAVWDENLPGFGFRVQAGGSKVYYVKYRVGDKQRLFKIGRVDKLSLADATKKAKSAFSAVADTIDPANERVKAASDASLTFNPAYDGYLVKLKAERSKSYYGQNKMYLETHFQELHGLSLASIDKGLLSEILEEITADRGAITANRARAAGSAFYNWAIGKFNGIEVNPFTKTNRNDETPRNRDFKPRELKAIWHTAPQNEFGDIVRLLMLLMQRRTEIGGLMTSEFKHNERQLEIDGSRTKNGLDSIIPLPDAAFEILSKYHDPKRKFLFGLQDNGYQGWSKSKAELDEALPQISKHWIFHDFRRNGKTAMEQELDVPDNVSEAILNHSKKGLAKVYNGAKYIKQKREALDKFADHLMAIVN